MQTDDGLFAFALIQLACCFNGIRDWLLIRHAREYCRSPTKLVDLGGSVIRHTTLMLMLQAQIDELQKDSDQPD